MSATTTDALIIGGGIAGISAAARLSAQMKVAVVEMESSTAYHSTGRSAAMFIRNYGPPAVRALNRLAEPFYRNPEGFSDMPLLSPRGEMTLDCGDDDAAFAAYCEDSVGLEHLTGEEACKIVPILRPDVVRRAVYEPDASDIDVHQLMSCFTRMAKANGATINSRHEALTLPANNGGWSVESTGGTYHAATVINAAGAWADELARRAGLRPMMITPKRRSAVVVPMAEGYDCSSWPLTVPATESWYIRPDNGRLMISPADADPVEAQDIHPDDMVLAEGIHRFEQATTMTVNRIEHQWAGLRSFPPDHNPVVGFAPDADGFFWLAWQGGYGIQTSPALSQLTAELITAATPECDAATLALLSPERFVEKGLPA
ncbi:MAG: FAD-binding oxidoreductase [Alphaproteobacteria bacterium]|nr:FAD-binding oxidoreductase [Alphaproteobacteria bacterium]